MIRRMCFVLLVGCGMASAQEAARVEVLRPGLGRLQGQDRDTGIEYARLFVLASSEGKPEGGAFDLALPTVTVQCTLDVKGKYRAEMFVNFGGVTDAAFYPPWRPKTKQDLYPPRTLKRMVTMEFLGYTKVKPAKRQFEEVVQPSGQLRYHSPGIGSGNMEEITYYFQYMRALPTLRVTDGERTATFGVGPLLEQMHKEPLCKASGV